MNVKIASVFALCALTILVGSPVVSAPATPRATPVTADDSATAAKPKQKRSVLTVVSVHALGEDGQVNVTTLGGKGDALMFSKAEEAVTASRAYRLVGRDAWETRAKEIKFNEEGFVDASSAKQFGSDVGVDKFLTVFVGGATQKRTVEDASSLDGVLNSVFGSGKKSSNKERAPYLECSTTIICRYTDVQTGERETKFYTGTCKDRTDTNAEGEIESSSINAAFESLRKDLWRNRQPFVGKVVQVKDEPKEGFVRIDLGKQDGIVPGIEFEFYAATLDGEFQDRTRLLGDKVMGKVIEVNNTNAKVELGELKKRRFPSSGKEWKSNPAYLKDLQKAFASTSAEKPVIEAVEKQ